MRKLQLLILVAILAQTISAQKLTNTEGKKQIFTKKRLFLEFGESYKSINRKHDLDTNYLGKGIVSVYSIQSLFIQKPVYNFYIGLNYNLLLSNNLTVTPFLRYFNRKTNFQIDSVMLIRFSSLCPENYKDVTQYNISQNNFESGINLGYRFNRFELQFGVIYSKASLINTTLTHLNGTKSSEKHNVFFRDKEMFPRVNLTEIYYCIGISYTIPLKGYYLIPSFGIETDNFLCYYFNFGLKLPVTINKNEF